MTTIYFDMDGTIADLYNYDGWLEYLKQENVKPYAQAETLIKTDSFTCLLNKLQDLGFTLGVISWSAKNGSKEYNKATRKAKRKWIKQHFPQLLAEFHVVKYGTPKHTVAKDKNSILVDDNINVRKAWTNGRTIDASNTLNMIYELQQLIA